MKKRNELNSSPSASRLGPTWPRRIEDVSSADPVFNGADVLIYGECTATLSESINHLYRIGRVTLTCCPEMYNMAYTEKIVSIFKRNNINSILLLRMELPCCDTLENSIRSAISSSGKNIPFSVEKISFPIEKKET